MPAIPPKTTYNRTQDTTPSKFPRLTEELVDSLQDCLAQQIIPPAFAIYALVEDHVSALALLRKADEMAAFYGDEENYKWTKLYEGNDDQAHSYMGTYCGQERGEKARDFRAQLPDELRAARVQP